MFSFTIDLLLVLIILVTYSRFEIVGSHSVLTQMAIHWANQLLATCVMAKEAIRYLIKFCDKTVFLGYL